MLKIRPLALLGVAAVAVGIAVAPTANSAQQAVAPRMGCAALTGIDFTGVPDAPSRVLSATQVTTAGITYCQVTGYIAPQTQFQLTLPVTTWQGQYVQVGCGGLCGDVPTAGANPAPPLSTGCAPVNNGELAIASDNEGHIGSNRLDGVWAKDDPALQRVYGFTSEHSLAQLSKAIIDSYYGTPPAFSYYDGCSDGGREALDEAQRYPTDFDGVLAGAPALDAVDFAGELESWIYRSGTDGTGHQILPAAKLPALHAAVLKACAGPDGLVDDPRTCDFQPASLRCPAGTDTNSCLTPAQVGVVRAFYTGPVDARGRNLYPGGLPYGSELAWAGWDVATSGNPLSTEAAAFAASDLTYLTNPPVALADFPFTDAEYARLQTEAATFDSTDPDLGAFRAHGGKIIIYHGWADQAIPPFGTTAYYRALAATTPDYRSFARLYMIPAQYHCLAGGDPQVSGDLLSPLMAWVRDGKAPSAVTFGAVRPAAGQPASVTVAPFDPFRPVNGHGLNANYRWIGHFS